MYFHSLRLLDSMEITNLQPNQIVNYFGVGSNMLKENLRNRGLAVKHGGTKISFNKMEPGVVKEHRLAFNMKGFLHLNLLWQELAKQQTLNVMVL